LGDRAGSAITLLANWHICATGKCGTRSSNKTTVEEVRRTREDSNVREKKKPCVVPKGSSQRHRGSDAH